MNQDDSATRATAFSGCIAMAIPAMTWKAALMLLGAVATSTASSLPQLAPAQEECDLRLWVRADDLSPSTIVEGDVRLLNNLTSLSDTALTACQIVDWSLVLRYRERAAMSIPLANVQLPEKPRYNYTWNSRVGRRQFKVDNIFSGGEDMASLFGNATDPYAAEKEDYNRRLEEYALLLSSADKWIIQEEEVTFFETALSVNTTMETVEGECCRLRPEPADWNENLPRFTALQQVTLPFAIAVPNVRFPPATTGMSGSFYTSESVANRLMVSRVMGRRKVPSAYSWVTACQRAGIRLLCTNTSFQRKHRRGRCRSEQVLQSGKY